MLRSIQKIFVVVLAMVFMVPAVYAVSDMPSTLKSMSTQQLKAYLASTVAPKKGIQAAVSTTSAYSVDDLVEWAKLDLRDQKPLHALAFLDFAISQDSAHQKAHFWRALAVLFSNPDMLQELKDRGVLDANNNFIPNASFSFPDVLEFKKYQGLTAGLVNEITSAKGDLAVLNETFSEDISDSNLGTIHLDYAAVQAVRIFLNFFEMKVHFANAYDTDYAQLTQNDLGKLTKANLASVTADTNALFADLVKFQYIRDDGSVTGRHKTIGNGFVAGVVIENSSVTPKQYVVYSLLAQNSYDSRVKLGAGDACGTHTLRSSAGASDLTFTPTLDATNGWCKSAVLTASPSWNFYTSGTGLITYKGSTYQVSGFGFYNNGLSPETYINTRYPIDTIAMHPQRTEILGILAGVEVHKVNFIDLINFYPKLGAIKSTTTAQLNAAKSSLIGAIDSYLAMSTYLRQRDEAEGVNYAIRMYHSPQNTTVNPQEYQNEKNNHTDDEAVIRQLLANIKTNLTSGGALVIPDDKLFLDNPYAGLRVNLSAIFTARDMRSLTTAINTENTKYKMISNGFSDPTLGGVFPGATPGDLNFAFDQGNTQISNISYNSSTHTANIAWKSMVSSSNAQYVTGVDVYRAETPQVNRASILITRTNAAASSVSDASIDSNVAAYYYRVYVSYRFDDGAEAESYSKPFKLTLNASASNQAPILFQVAPQTVNEGQNVQFNVTAVDADRDPVQLTALLANGAPLSSIGATLTSSRSGNTTTGVFVLNNPRAVNGGLTIVFTADDTRGARVTMPALITVNSILPDLTVPTVSMQRLGMDTNDTMHTKLRYALAVTVNNASIGTAATAVAQNARIQVLSVKRDGEDVPVSSFVRSKLVATQLATGASKTVIFGSFVAQNPGHYEITVAVDPTNAIQEASETNNSSTLVFDVYPLSTKIYGIVRDAVTRQAIPDATVVVAPGDADSVGTGNKGTYEMFDFEPGTYTVSVSCPGYISQSKTVVLKTATSQVAAYFSLKK